VTEIEPDWEYVKECVATITNGLASGRGMVISPFFIMTALHGSFEDRTPFTITTLSAKARTGYVLRQWFEASSKVDIVLIKLDAEREPFSHR